MKLKEMNFETNNGRISIHKTEDRKGFPKLLCIHGGPGLGHGSLLPGILALNGLFDLVLVNLSGEGGSSPFQDGKYTLENYAEEIIQIKESIFPHEKCGIFGHSFGGFIGIKMLGQNQEKFSFAILSNTASNSSWQISASEAVSLLPDTKNVMALDNEFKRSPTDALYKELCLKFSSLYFPELPEVEAKNIMTGWSYRAAPYVYAEENVFSQMNVKEDCERIHVPCLIIGSSLDKVVPWYCQVKLSSEIKTATLMSMSDCGHFPFVTKSKEFSEIVHNWWAKAKGAL